MAKAGRKRKEKAVRHPCGQIKQPAKDEKRADQLRVILTQPHRRGTENPMDQKHESSFGRFCIRRKLREEIYTAGGQFAALVRRWRAAKGVPTQLRLGEGGSGLGPSDETVARWGCEIAGIDHGVIARSDPRGYLAIRTMILDEAESDPRLDDLAQVAAFWLAVETGNLTARESPFLQKRA